MTKVQTSRARVGVVGVPDGWSSLRLVEAVRRRCGDAQLIEPRRLALDLTRNSVRHGGLELVGFDALIVKKLGSRYAPHLLDRLEILRFLEARGVRVFSRADSIARLLDRMSCTVVLGAAGIPMPETVLTEDLDEAIEAVRRFGAAILKPLFTSKARGMLLLETGAALRAQLSEFQDAGNRMLYLQRRIPLPGRDLGVVFLGGEYVASYARVASGAAWNTTTTSGGKYQPADPGDEILALAHRAQALFDLDFTCVDVAEGPDGPVVFEVSAFGGFRGLLEAHQMDAAGLYVDHVLRRLAHEPR